MTVNNYWLSKKCTDKKFENEPPRPLLIEVLKTSQFSSGMRDIDLGCGAGIDTLHLLRNQWNCLQLIYFLQASVFPSANLSFFLSYGKSSRNRFYRMAISLDIFLALRMTGMKKMKSALPPWDSIKIGTFSQSLLKEMNKSMALIFFSPG